MGGLHIFSDSKTFFGTASALSDRWILTAAHNVDIDGDGRVDSGLSLSFHLPGYESVMVSTIQIHPDFTGFANPHINDDLALLYLSAALPSSLNHPILGKAAVIGDTINLVGFGRSGFGSYGYTSDATLTQRRLGANVIDSFEADDEGSGFAEVFLYDFDDPTSFGNPGGSLGNDVETIITPGDSGGPALLATAEGNVLVGVNTFTEGGSGLFGEHAGGILIDPYLPWINQITGLPVPEPNSCFVVLVAVAIQIFRRARTK